MFIYLFKFSAVKGVFFFKVFHTVNDAQRWLDDGEASFLWLLGKTFWVFLSFVLFISASRLVSLHRSLSVFLPRRLIICLNYVQANDGCLDLSKWLLVTPCCCMTYCINILGILFVFKEQQSLFNFSLYLNSLMNR